MSENQQPKILVVTPMMGGLTPETSASITAYSNSRRYPSQIRFINDTYIHFARNRAVQMAAQEKATHLMFIDSDIAFPFDGVDRLVEQHEYIVGGLYFGRKVPMPVALQEQTREDGQKQLEILTDPPTFEKEFEVTALGTGFMLIDMRVFQKIDPPFFYFADPTAFGYVKKAFPNIEVGEDVAFCLKAREHGFKIYCDPTIPLGHSGRKTYTRSDYIRYHKEGIKDIYSQKIW